MSVDCNFVCETLCQLARDSVPHHRILNHLLALTDGDEALELALLRVGHCLAWGSEYYALAHIGQSGGWQAHLAQAVYLIVRTQGDTEAIQRAIVRTEGLVQTILSCYLDARAGV
ncbi:MAG: hypothetical protein NZ750_01330 [Anaerolineae bacterium]|nr:hypothetical protein [Anaerolineae bacterium]MDW8173227.1 hypothetical protein [Anaerolineae bacterium]